MAKKGCNCDDCDEDRKHAAEQAIRADERAKIVAMIRHEGNQWSHATKVILLDLANRIECIDTKPGQPKEGGQ
jgi:hypothetical protein